jgi:hypothetical protein
MARRKMSMPGVQTLRVSSRSSCVVTGYSEMMTGELQIGKNIVKQTAAPRPGSPAPSIVTMTAGDAARSLVEQSWRRIPQKNGAVTKDPLLNLAVSDGKVIAIPLQQRTLNWATYLESHKEKTAMERSMRGTLMGMVLVASRTASQGAGF